MSQTRLIWLFVLLTALLIMVGCSSNLDSPLPVLVATLSPYFTRTPVVLPSQIISVNQTAAPTLTPIIYKIVQGDTLSGIAKRYGVSLDALLAFNPGIVPEALTIGQVLTIPNAGQQDQPFSATPVPLDLGNGICSSSGAGVICLVPVHNPYPQSLENVKVLLTLYDQNGQPLASQESILPLNVLAPNQSLPADAFFKDMQGWASVHSGLVTSMRIESGDLRYLQTTVQNLLVSINWDGLSANVQGQILLTDARKPARSLWLVAVAYAADDQIVGYRRWEWAGSLLPGALQPFELPVYSLGPPIQRVEVLVEARP